MKKRIQEYKNTRIQEYKNTYVNLFFLPFSNKKNGDKIQRFRRARDSITRYVGRMVGKA